jgi:hypothetical protein
MDSFYCVWNGTACKNPGAGETTEFIAWDPGCYLFDTDLAACANTSGCYNNAGACVHNITTNPANVVNCSMLRNQTLCNSIPVLSSCCKWQGSGCVADRFDQKCRTDMQDPPEGCDYCEDYTAYTSQASCQQIAGNPWYMPCVWNNATARCEFKGDDVFGSGERNIMMIDNQLSCESAGGKWVTNTYCSSNNASNATALSMGWCEFKFNEERNCNKECYACEFKSDKTSHGSSSAAEDACMASKLGFCGFTADTSAPNGFGYCKPKDEFRKGVALDCKTDCGSCTYMGDPAAAEKYTGTVKKYETCKAPSCFCGESPADCKWIPDPSNPTDEAEGRCGSTAEKTCADRCDKCYEESVCTSTGGKQGNTTASAVCEWSSGVCVYKSGADQMEICWDGVDNNNDGKMDCADSMCYSDSFCGGNFMVGTGTNCFGFTDQTSCAAGGCTWMSENWGTWCDMPGASCWKNDGNQTACQQNGNCSWHSGSGGFCEEDWDKGGAANVCFTLTNHTQCTNATGASNNCVWMQDEWCTTVGGSCMQESGATWKDCWTLYGTGNPNGANSTACNADTSCMWQPDPWCQQQGANAGWCDHISFTCWKYDDEGRSVCENATLGAWCRWVNDSYSPHGGYCQNKNMNTCWNIDQATYGSGAQGNCTAAGCNWISGLCDPIGFGGEMTAGQSGGYAETTTMGGSGMSCFKYNGNETQCNNQTGCGWYSEPWPFCDVNTESNCPQYSNNQTKCNIQPRCKYNTNMNFCDEKPFECYTNLTLMNNLAACGVHPLCSNASGFCQPKSTTATTQQTCLALNSSLFRWVNGWCNPAMAATFFAGATMEKHIPLGTDAIDANVLEYVDIIDFGMKEMPNAFGFGIGVQNIANASACNDMRLNNGLNGNGHNTSKAYWYLDTDGSRTGNCVVRHNSSLVGFEFYLKGEWSFDTYSQSIVETLTAYRCDATGNWTVAEIRTSTDRGMMCGKINGYVIGVEKSELEKFPSLYTSGSDIRVAVVTADSIGNVTHPSDSASPAYATPGTQDFDMDGLNMFKFESNETKKTMREGMNTGYIDYANEADCWTQAGCAEYVCKDHPYCVNMSYGVEAPGFVDTRVPKMKAITVETFPDSAFISYFTDKPTNGSLQFYDVDSTCKLATINATINDIGVTNVKSRDYKLWHTAEIDSASLGRALLANRTYYYKIEICDSDGKCGKSKCSSFKTELDYNCPMCKFVVRIKAPTGWDVYYDVNQDGTYEHQQGAVCGANAGMLVNYTDAKRANIRILKSDNSTFFDFNDVRLTKTGFIENKRNISSTSSFGAGTTTGASSSTVGYTGMVEETRDKIIHSMFPTVCQVKIPKGTTTCDELWHCDSTLTKCIERTNEATLNATQGDYCIWEIPYCEFSSWAGGQPTTQSGSNNNGGGGGGGGGTKKTTTTTEETPAPVVPAVPVAPSGWTGSSDEEEAPEAVESLITEEQLTTEEGQVVESQISEEESDLAGAATGLFGSTQAKSIAGLAIIVLVLGVLLYMLKKTKHN